MKIADVLRQDDPVAGDGGTIASDPPLSPPPLYSITLPSSLQSITAALTPRSVLSRLLVGLRKLSAFSGGCEREPKESRCWCRRIINRKRGEPVIMVSPVATKKEEPSTPRTGSRTGGQENFLRSGGKLDDTSFYLGIGAGLILHQATRATEFSRIMTMQRQMEKLLIDIKSDVKRKDVCCASTESSNNTGSYASDCSAVITPSKRLSFASCVTLDMEEPMRNMVKDGPSNYNESLKNICCPEMDELETELEIELERMHLNLEKENYELPPGPHGVKATKRNVDSSESFTLSFSNNKKFNEDEFYGIPPHELERRLHELQQARQQEQIEELESALEFTRRKLQEKYSEASWWRETAMLATNTNLIDPFSE